jgi:hypothetical protein
LVLVVVDYPMHCHCLLMLLKLQCWELQVPSHLNLREKTQSLLPEQVLKGMLGMMVVEVVVWTEGSYQ